MAHYLLRSKQAADGTNEELLNSPSVSDRADAKDYNSPFASKGTEFDPHHMGSTKVADTMPVVPSQPSGWKPWYKGLPEGDHSRNHEPSPPNPDITETSNFYAWFRDSKVVDADGWPLVVYHSTPSNDKQLLRRGGSLFGQFGFWFDSVPHTTEGYAGGESPKESPNTMAVYLSIQNPKEFAGIDELREIADGKYGPTPIARMQKLRRDLKKMGFDGAVVKNKDVNYWVAFDKDQIKSATGNSGAFAKGVGMMAALKTAASASQVDYLQLAKAIAGTIELLARIAPKGENIQVWAESNHQDLTQFVKEETRKQQKAAVTAARKPKCPHCGSAKYTLMPTDFETAKCEKCGKNWDHGIVPGINDPKQAAIEMHKDPKILPPRNDMRSHLDKDVKDELELEKQGSASPKK